MSHVNLWIALTDAAKTTLRPLLDDEDYAGPHLTAVRIFRNMIEYGTVTNMFKSPTLAGTKYHLFSLTFNDIHGQAAQKLQAALVYLEDNYTNQFEVVGAWKWDGSQIMDNSVSPAVPFYPLHPQLVKFMPDVWDTSSPPQLIAATELTDVNLIQGQAHRDFS